jgi:hypothetical protein
MHRLRHLNLIRAAAAAFGLGLAALGVMLVLGASASGSTQPSSPRVQLDSTECVESGSSGSALRGHCTFVLTDGRRFECPVRFSQHLQTPASLERAKACHPLTPIRIPASWQPVLRRLDRVEACLDRDGLTVRGGPFFNANPKRVPIGELVLLGAKPPALSAFIAFYTSARVARRAVPAIRKRLEGTAGSLRRDGSVTVIWATPPAAAMTATTYGCAFS